MEFSGVGISNLFIIVLLCFRSRDYYQLKKKQFAVPPSLPAIAIYSIGTYLYRHLNHAS